MKASINLYGGLLLLPTFRVFGVDIAMYGLMVLAGIAAGIIVAVLRAQITAQKKDDLFFASLYGAIGTVIGAKILYLITILPDIIRNFDYLIHHLDEASILLTGGFVFYGGLIGGVSAILIYCKQYKLRFFPLVEALTPSIPLIHAFGRMGCFFAGCCYGIEFPQPIGMYFSKSPVAPHNVPLFPVQLLEAILNLVIFAILLYVARRRRRPGVIIGSYLIMYPISRFTLEYFRYDEYRGFFLGLSTSQWISIALFIAGLYLVIHTVQKHRKSDII